MPIYEYQCADCKQIFEEWQQDFKDRDLTCPICGGKATRLISNTSFILKGGGWYVTDYGRGNNGGGKKTPPTAETTKASDTAKDASSATSSTASDAS